MILHVEKEYAKGSKKKLKLKLVCSKHNSKTIYGQALFFMKDPETTPLTASPGIHACL